VRFVPRPFQEAFEHPQVRVDTDSKSFVLEIFGPAGLTVALGSVFVAAIVVALSTGLYAPDTGQPDKAASPSVQQSTPSDRQ